MAAGRLDKKALASRHLEVYVGLTLNSVVLKLYKKEWANDPADPVNAPTRIFFAIWVNENTLKENRIYYNIHALKLRQLKGYAITSREFASNFRQEFKKYKTAWKNVSVNFGPATLMEGWESIENEDPENIVLRLSGNFLQIEQLIDLTLKEFIRVKKGAVDHS